MALMFKHTRFNFGFVLENVGSSYSGLNNSDFQGLFFLLALAVLKLHSAIHRIKRYPVDNS